MNSEKIPDYLYHYTSLSTLALILKTKQLAFNNLTAVDDTDESKTSDLGDLGRFVYVSAWTAQKSESIPFWSMYTSDMHGVRIKLPVFPFKKYTYKKGEYHLTEDVVESYIDFHRVYEENRGTMAYNAIKLCKVEYTNDEQRLYPSVFHCNSQILLDKWLKARTLKQIPKGLDANVSVVELGNFKRKAWSFQREWRYKLFISPIGWKELEAGTIEVQQELVKRVLGRSEMRYSPYDRFMVDLDEDILREAEITFGPRMTQGEKELAVLLLQKHGIHKYHDSTLHIR